MTEVKKEATIDLLQYEVSKKEVNRKEKDDMDIYEFPDMDQTRS